MGRFTGVDPISDQVPWVSTFNYAENRPVSGIDLWGLQYLDANLAMKIDKSSINLTGSLVVNVKIVNLSSSLPQQQYIDYHSRKSSVVFDELNSISFDAHVNFDPNTGKTINKSYRINSDVDIDFSFSKQVQSDLEGIEKGDVVLLLVNELKKENGRDIDGKAGGGAGHVYAIEIDKFNQSSKIDSHEKGHLIGNLLDLGSAPTRLMGKGPGYEVTFKEKQEVVNNLIYRRGMEKRGFGGKHTDIRKIVTEFIKEYVEK